MAYTRKRWENGEVITATALNNIEDGIVELKQANTQMSGSVKSSELHIGTDADTIDGKDGSLTVSHKITADELKVNTATFTNTTTFQGTVTVPTPTEDTHASTKQYVDGTKNALTTQMNNTFALKTTTIQAGTGLTVTAGGTLNGNTELSLNIADKDKLGGIKVGSNLDIDNNGVLNATNTTYSVATTTTDGLMSATDKNKLDGIADGAKVGTVTSIQINGITKDPTEGVIDLENIVTSITMNNESLTNTEGTVALDQVITNAVSNRATKENPQFTGTATFGDISINANNSTISFGRNSLNSESLGKLYDLLPGDSVTNGHTYTLQLTKNNDTLQFIWVQVPENGGE